MDVNDHTYFDVSLSQKANFFWSLCVKKKAIPFNISFSIDLRNVNYGALNKTFSFLIQQYEIFRTTLLMIDGVVKQKVLAYDPKSFKIEFIDLINSLDKMEILEKLKTDSQQIIFKPYQHPWINVKLVRVEEKKHRLLISIAHMICDMISVGYIKKEISQLYESCIRGEDLIPSNIIQYKDYISEINEILKSEKGEKHRVYWMDVFKEIPSNNLTSTCSNFKHHKSESYRAIIQREIKECCGELSPMKAFAILGEVSFLKYSKGSAYFIYIDQKRMAFLKGLHEISHVNLSVILIATFHLLIFIITGERDVVIGLNVNLRDNKRFKEVIGFLINTVLLRYKIDDSLTIINYIQEIWTCFTRAFRHRIYPFEKALFDSDVPLHRVGTFFLNIKNHEDIIGNADNLNAFHKEGIEYPYFDIDCHINLFKNIVEIQCNFKTDFFTKSSIESIFKTYMHLIDNFKLYERGTIADLVLSLKNETGLLNLKE
jgi:hypothetical protein